MSEAVLTRHVRPDRSPHSLAEWQALGGYQAVALALKAWAPAQIVETVKASGLRGRGGAGFPAGVKWGFMPDKADKPHYLAVNGDEMEPGNFKDRLLMEALPHQVLEGVIIASYALAVDEAFLFVRDAYALAARRLEAAIAEAEAAGWLGDNIQGSGYSLRVHVHESAGRYICGEESALIEALEGKRAIPRQRPPYPAQSGLWGCPTTVNNVETLCNVPHILLNGADWYRQQGRHMEGGTKIFGISGRVRKPGWVELPMGTPLGAVLDQAGGVIGKRLVGILPGGASSAFLGPDDLDVLLDFDGCKQAGSGFGTGQLIVLDEAVCPVAVLANLERFFARESCGWCTPCRDGLPWTVRLLDAIEAGQGTRRDIELLKMHVTLGGPSGRSFCGLMPGAMQPLKSGLDRYAEIFDDHLARGCAWRRA